MSAESNENTITEERLTLERRTLEGTGRVYINDNGDVMPSVTTIFDVKPTPTGLKIWKQQNDGKGDNMHWKEILDYKSARGTLIHFDLLRDYMPTEPGEDKAPLGKNEEHAERDLRDTTKWDSTDGDRWMEFEDDLRFAQSVWPTIRHQLGISDESVLDAECFVQNVDIGYAGQFDLLYLNEHGEVVLADLKTSKRVYDKHKMQLTSYAEALNFDVDRLEVIRIHPDSERWQISSNEDWNESREELFAQFVDLRERFGRESDADLETIAREGIDDG